MNDHPTPPPSEDADSIVAPKVRTHRSQDSVADLEQEEEENLRRFQGPRRSQERRHERPTWQHPFFWVPTLAVFMLGGAIALGIGIWHKSERVMGAGFESGTPPSNIVQESEVATMPSSLCGDWYISQFMDQSEIVQPGPVGGMLMYRAKPHSITLMTGPNVGSPMKFISVRQGSKEMNGKTYAVTVFANDGQNLLYIMVTHRNEEGTRPLFIYDNIKKEPRLMASMMVDIR